ncbi:peptidoglycan amidohydrolase family protein [Lactococcus cremoris]|uniref:peptidoglycan amidohydrolase family protein n=1 Tax=Lactococcus lactis subsp. cremoris TaxID=1359 RepID=UPI002870CA78|nr:peptidoglycan amidohydrolase family protein [Lactococcus cremoris]MDR9868402.1 peptidoglycan amidohydrolase family protein [Lactococcus cremoris]
MTLNIGNGIGALKQQIGCATYSMYGSRNFSDGTCDCSGSVYYALRLAGASSFGYIPSTETMHQWLLDNNYELIAENAEWQMKAQDVIIWGRKGESAGSGGHTGIAVDSQNWIECTAWYGGGNGPEGGVIISNHDQRWTMCEQPYFYVYRLKYNTNQSSNIQPIQPTKENSKMIYIFNVVDANGKPTGGSLLFDGQNTLAFAGKNAEAAFNHYKGTYKEITGKDIPTQSKTQAQFGLWNKLYPTKYIQFN